MMTLKPITEGVNILFSLASVVSKRPLLVITLLGCLWIASLDKSSANSLPVKDKWALLVGIDHFRVKGLDLHYAREDAISMAAYLKSAGFAPDHIKLLTDEDATRDDILKSLGETWLPQVVDEQDLVFIYVSSHGMSAENNSAGLNYIITHDTEPNAVYTTAIPTQDFVRIIKTRIPAKQIVIVADTCFSGAIQEDLQGKWILQGLDCDELFHGTGQAVICSSAPDEPSAEVPSLKGGLFTHFLIEGLKSKGDSTSLQDAFEYTQKHMSDFIVAGHGRGRQIQEPQFDFDHELNKLQIAAPSTSPHNGPIPGRACPSPISNDIHAHTAWSNLFNQGRALFNAGKLDEAEQKYREAVVLADRQFGDDNWRLATTLADLGNALSKKASASEAVSVTERAISIARKAYGSHHPYVGHLLSNLSYIYFSCGGQPESAEKLALESNEILEKRAPSSLFIMLNLARLAELCSFQMRVEEAKAYMGKALSLAENCDDKLIKATVYHDAGVVYRCIAQSSSSEQYFKKSLAIKETMPTGSQLAGTQLALAVLYNGMPGRAMEARSLLESAIPTMRAQHIAELPTALANLAMTYQAEKQFDKAEELYKEAANELNSAKDRDSSIAFTVFYKWGEMLSISKRFEEATKPLLMAREISKRTKDKVPVNTASVLELLERAYRKSGHFHEAEATATEGKDFTRRSFGAESDWYAYELVHRAYALEKLGRKAEACAEGEEGNKILLKLGIHDNLYKPQP